MFFTDCQTIVIASLVLIAGCSKSGPQVAPVHGRITLDGQPLPDTSVVFKAPGMSPTGGRTDENGNYELIYKRGVKGAPIGMNQVTILEDTQKTRGPQRVPTRYNQESDLQREVKPGDNVIDFELTTETNGAKK
jgi:hypothetical protein